VNFASLGLSEPILEGVRAAGYRDPTEIQARAIPLIRQGRDLIALGQTGSGKTAAYGLPLLERVLQRARTAAAGLRALVLVPTRELCVQVAESLRLYASATELKVCTAFGGVPLGIQEAAFKRGLDVLVACPGRLLDHLERGNVTLANLELAVLDEADRMLDMGFLPQIRRIFMRCPRERQNLLLSATLPGEIEALCRDFLPDAQRVQIGKRSQSPSTISHRFEFVAGAQKLRALERVLAQEPGRVLIFVRTKLRAAQLGRQLRAHGLPADSIHGDKEAAARYGILQAFDRGAIRFLVATDVAARGIDVDAIELVVNFEMPRAVEDYVHRVGRTGRAGARGRALSLVGPEERRVHQAIVKHLQTTGAATAARPSSAQR
jgi:ATP-dependent RNA helicase RhlE